MDEKNVANNLSNEVNSVDKTFNNLHFTKRFRFHDIVFVIATFILIVAIFGSIVFGVAFGLHAGVDSLIAYVFFLLVWIILAIVGLLKKDGERRWIRWYKWEKYKTKYKVVDTEKLDKDWFIKMIAVNPVTNIANVGFLTHDINGPVVLYVRTDRNSVNDFRQIEEAYNWIERENEFFSNLKILDEEHEVAVDRVLFNDAKFDTTKQLAALKEATINNLSPIQLTLIYKQMALYEDIPGWFSSENEPEMFKSDARPFELINHYSIFAIKGNSYAEALNRLKQLRVLYANLGELTPLTYTDLKNMFNKYFGNNLNFNIEQPVNQTPINLPASEDENSYNLYNITNNPKDDNLVVSSVLNNISSVEIKPSYLILNNINDKKAQKTYVAIRGFKDLPNRFNLGWGLALNQQGVSSMVVEKLVYDKKRTLSRHMEQMMKANNSHFEKSIAAVKENRYNTDQVLWDEENSKRYARALNQDSISLINYRYYVLIHGDNERDIIRATNQIDDILNTELRINNDKKQHYEYEQYETFLSMFPSCSDLLLKRKFDSNFMSSLAIAQAFPYVKNSDLLDEGVIIGVSKDRQRLAVINPLRHDLANSFNQLVVASTGSGKSKFTSNEAMYFGIFSKLVKCCFFDPNGDYKQLVENNGGQNIETNPNTTKNTPVAENIIYATNKTKTELYLDTLLNLSIDAKNVIERELLIQYGTGYFIKIINKKLTPADFARKLATESRQLDITTRESLSDLYKIIYNHAVKKNLQNIFRVEDYVGEVSEDGETRIKPAAYEVFDAFKKHIHSFFAFLLPTANQIQIDLIHRCVDLLYEEKCGFKVNEDSNGQLYISRNTSKSGELSVEDLLNWDRYPVFNDFFAILQREANIEMNKSRAYEHLNEFDLKDQIDYTSLVPISRRDYYWDLVAALKQFAVTYDSNNKVQVGAYSHYWNTDNANLKLDAQYVAFHTDQIAKSQEIEMDTNKEIVYANENTIGQAQFYLVMSQFRAAAAANGTKKFGVSQKKQPFIMLFWDEAHNLIKVPDIARQTLRLMKEVRKWNVGVCLISQDIDDFTKRAEGGESMINNAALKIILGLSIKGWVSYKQLIDNRTTKEQEDWILDPLGYGGTILRTTVNTHPPGYMLVSPNNQDLMLAPVKGVYSAIDMMLTGSNDYPGGVGIKKLWDSAKKGQFPISSHDDPNNPRKLNAKYTSFIMNAMIKYEENKGQLTLTSQNQTTKLLQQNKKLQKVKPMSMIELINFDNM